ncbi:hypothetical protein HK096_002951, partial [Nowakowskiella sp. JEL0078]
SVVNPSHRMSNTEKAIESLLASQKRQLRGHSPGPKAFREYFGDPYTRGSSLTRKIVSDSEEDDQATPDTASTTSTRPRYKRSSFKIQGAGSSSITPTPAPTIPMAELAMIMEGLKEINGKIALLENKVNNNYIPIVEEQQQQPPIPRRPPPRRNTVFDRNRMWEENSEDTEDKIAEVWPTTDETAFKFYNTPIITKECKFLQEDMKELSETLYKTKKSRNSNETEVLLQIRSIVKVLLPRPHSRTV